MLLDRHFGEVRKVDTEPGAVLTMMDVHVRWQLAVRSLVDGAMGCRDPAVGTHGTVAMRANAATEEDVLITHDLVIPIR